MKKKDKILIHLVFWVIILISTSLEVIPSLGKYSSGLIAGDYFIYLASHVLVFYLYYVFLNKKHLGKNRAAQLILYGILVITVISLPVTYLLIYFISNEILDLSGKKFLFAFGSHYFSILQTNFIYAVSGSLLKLSMLWYENVMQQKETEKKYLKGELALLRSQINPRFLSNSLGHIRSLVDEHPGNAIYSIENLSEIMSYMLYETSAERVPLEGEVNYIRNYLKLQEVRYPPGYLSLEVSGNTSRIMVPPLLFMPFLEYTFNSASAKCANSPAIKILINVSVNELMFESGFYVNENTVRPEAGKAFSLSSIKHFLELQFGSNYTLDSIEENNKIVVSLKVKLNV